MVEHLREIESGTFMSVCTESSISRKYHSR